MNEQELVKEIRLIKDRNGRVEMDKAWEVSWTRRLLIASITYVVACVWLLVISEKDIFLKAVVPTGGYLLSTFSIPYVKKRWILRRKDTGFYK